MSNKNLNPMSNLDALCFDIKRHCKKRGDHIRFAKALYLSELSRAVADGTLKPESYLNGHTSDAIMRDYILCKAPLANPKYTEQENAVPYSAYGARLTRIKTEVPALLSFARACYYTLSYDFAIQEIALGIEKMNISFVDAVSQANPFMPLVNSYRIRTL